MDLGIVGRDAIVCASTSGLGLACATALAAEGVNVVVNGHTPERLESALEAVRATASGQVTGQLADITTADGRAALFATCPDPDILVTNNVGPRPGNFFDISDADFEEAMLLHYWTPLALVRTVIEGMQARKFGRIVNITSAMVASPGATMAASAGARTGLTAVMKELSRDVVRDNVTINQLLPEQIDTPRQIQVAKVIMERDGITFEQARERQVQHSVAHRLGRPSEFGAASAFLCSVHAGFINGTNLRLDGGSYSGLI